MAKMTKREALDILKKRAEYLNKKKEILKAAEAESGRPIRATAHVIREIRALVWAINALDTGGSPQEKNKKAILARE